MATENEIQNMAVSLSKTGVAANMAEALELARNLLAHQEEKQKLKAELKQKEEKERDEKLKSFTLPPVRLGVEGDIDLNKSLNEILSEPEPSSNTENSTLPNQEQGENKTDNTNMPK